MSLYSIIQGIPDKYGVLKYYSILITFTDRDRAHVLFDEMKKRPDMQPCPNDCIMHTPTGVTFRIMYHNAI